MLCSAFEVLLVDYDTSTSSITSVSTTVRY